MFQCVESAWKSASEQNMGDVRELIPEFYYLPELFENKNNFSFGKNQKGREVDRVNLPVWAKGNPRAFVDLMRQALESDHVRY